ncbi:hypothetical protein NEIMUCOT_04385 [Neisseria mucosa ATCC 25996]|uniref:Uncharacterized protein n=2 Tax=Neisseria TaxID=482 RepID=D2ZUU3_NEIM2|nr:hypothetical protein NEIMUCOT_04385 [Neisseria mucosa ATCC 25996]
MWMMVLDMIFSCCRDRLKDGSFDENGVDYRIKPSDCVGYGYFQTTLMKRQHACVTVWCIKVV